MVDIAGYWEGNVCILYFTQWLASYVSILYFLQLLSDWCNWLPSCFLTRVEWCNRLIIIGRRHRAWMYTEWLLLWQLACGDIKVLHGEMRCFTFTFIAVVLLIQRCGTLSVSFSRTAVACSIIVHCVLALVSRVLVSVPISTVVHELQ